MDQKIAVPVSQGILSSHFGHCEMFAIYTIEDKRIISKEIVTPPVHEPGSHPSFLKEAGCNLIIAGGMGIKAQNLFTQYGIRVIVGAVPTTPEEVIGQYLKGNLVTGNNLCDH